MISKVFTTALCGITARPVSVETDIAPGLATFQIVGLADASVQEARQRLHSAIKQAGFKFPTNMRITINLAPADIKKEGSGFDLPIALSILTKTLPLPVQKETVFLGELGLDGTLRPVRGVLAAALCAAENGFQALVVPRENSAEAALVQKINVLSADSLKEVVAHLLGYSKLSAAAPLAAATVDHDNCIWEKIADQKQAKRVLEIAATGKHNILLFGPPGTGKTMLARALPEIMPPLTRDEALETTQIYSAAGLIQPENLPLQRAPFRSPHHSASATALVGGGRPIKPGEMTLAHNGVLFLDEFPEFQRVVLEQLRQPLEDGVVHVARAAETIAFPAKFLLVAAQNPCPCGFGQDQRQPCTCTITQIRQYAKKLSGPLLDRIDLHCEVPRVALEKIDVPQTEEKCAAVRRRIIHARAFLHQENIVLIPTARTFALAAAEKLHLSARAYQRLINVGRTIAALDNSTQIHTAHLAEALQYRQLNARI